MAKLALIFFYSFLLLGCKKDSNLIQPTLKPEKIEYSVIDFSWNKTTESTADFSIWVKYDKIDSSYKFIEFLMYGLPTINDTLPLIYDDIFMNTFSNKPYSGIHFGAIEIKKIRAFGKLKQ